jgi:uncharacterized protein
MTTITPLHAAVAGASAVAAVVLGLGAGYAWGTREGSPRPVALAAATGAPSGTATAVGITVSGTGTVSGTPDSLRLSMGVSVTRPTVTAALDAANGSAAKLQSALRQRGVAEKDLQTSGVSIQPQYAESGGGKAPAISGYAVEESVTAVLRDLKRAGDTITAAAQAGGDATRITSVSLDLTDTGALVTAARGRAFDQAKEKAQQYAKAAGMRLSAVVSITEQVQTPQPLDVSRAAAVPDAAKAVPIAAGSAEVAVTVTVVFGVG